MGNATVAHGRAGRQALGDHNTREDLRIFLGQGTGEGGRGRA